VNVDTGEFRDLAAKVAELEKRVAVAQRMARDAVRLREIVDGAGMPPPVAMHTRQRDGVRVHRHLRVIE
jgi:hypothetical protein